jgi:squalene-hopene/tetraprenyl-beta-curcumene cyclase
MNKLYITGFLSLLVIISGQISVAEKVINTTQPAGTISESVQREVAASIDRGIDWLVANQSENGAWSNQKFPALTALAVRALIESPSAKENKDAISKALKFIMSCVQPDGGIYCNVAGRKGGGLSNYNTSICMMALHAADKQKYEKTILNARKFVAAGQHFGDDVYVGGFGYDKSTKRAYTDLLNTFYSARAMHETQDVEDNRPAGEKKVDIDWQATEKFVSEMQNKDSAGTNDSGGFFYNPTSPKAGVGTNAEGVVYFRSYGSITYAGLLALIYADVDQRDPRVTSAFDWAFKHWSLEENPGVGQEGLFFFYNVLTKTLAASRHNLIPQKNGKFVNWREEVAKKIVSMQKIDVKNGNGYWLNDKGRYWESDPVLVTAYSLLALENL